MDGLTATTAIALGVIALVGCSLLIRTLHVVWLEWRVKRYLPVTVGLYVHTANRHDVVQAVIDKLEKFGIQVLPLHIEAAHNLLVEHFWQGVLTTSTEGRRVDLVIVGDLRSWIGSGAGSAYYYRFALRPYNRIGYELPRVDDHANEVSLNINWQARLVHIGYVRVLQAILTLQRYVRSDPKWSYNTARQVPSPNADDYAYMISRE